MNTWKPTEGLKRAEAIVRDIEQAGVATLAAMAYGADSLKLSRDPIYRHRLVEIIATAIDQALRDGSEMDALASVVGSFPAGSTVEMMNGPAGKYTVVPLAESVEIDHPDGSSYDHDAAARQIAAAPKKRGRGRPKGSKKKAKPQAEPTEMQP